ncbi:DUF1697 domain-containing protein [Croceiramulus getboli]|nr:DUF1697 domain-containing protein [Flavobacteriaceae bacterium YJPT1-3]
MTTYIALLRGINVAGKHRVPMKDLRSLMEGQGYRKVTTYIQSGNLVFQAPPSSTLRADLETLIQQHFGFEVPVWIAEPSELQRIHDACPFQEPEKQQSYFTFPSQPLSTAAVTLAATFERPMEQVMITAACIYSYFEQGYGRSKMNNTFWETKLGVDCTTRNYRTVCKLLALASQD